MAKTRRKKINRSPRGNPNVKLAVVERGTLMAIKGLREDPTKMQADKKATPVWAGRVYTGVNRGKVYPYAGTKRGSPPAGGGDAV